MSVNRLSAIEAQRAIAVLEECLEKEKMNSLTVN